MILTYSNIRSIRPIAENMLDEKRLLPYIKEVENLSLKPLITPLFYKTLSDYVSLINSSNADDDSHIKKYDILLNGGIYDSDTMETYGLNEALGYLVYSRFVKNQNVNATAFGLVQKLTQNSEPIEEKTIFRISNDAEKIGMEYLRGCIEYLKYIGEIPTCKKIKKYQKFIAIG